MLISHTWVHRNLPYTCTGLYRCMNSTQSPGDCSCRLQWEKKAKTEVTFTLMDFVFHFTGIVCSIIFMLVFFCTLTWVCVVTVVVSIFTVLTLGAGAVVQALPTLPCSAVTVADGVLVHMAITLAWLALFGRAVLAQGVSIKTVITYFATRAFKNMTNVINNETETVFNS